MTILITLIPVLFQLIMYCIEKYGEEAVFDRLRNRPRLVQLQVFLASRRQGHNRSESMALAREAVEVLEDASDEDIRGFMKEASDGR